MVQRHSEDGKHEATTEATKASACNGCFLSWRTQADSNRIPAQIPCRHCSLSVWKLLPMRAWDLTHKTEERFVRMGFYFWNCVPHTNLLYNLFLSARHKITAQTLLSCKDLVTQGHHGPLVNTHLRTIEYIVHNVGDKHAEQDFDCGETNTEKWKHEENNMSWWSQVGEKQVKKL